MQTCKHNGSILTIFNINEDVRISKNYKNNPSQTWEGFFVLFGFLFVKFIFQKLRNVIALAINQIGGNLGGNEIFQGNFF